MPCVKPQVRPYTSPLVKVPTYPMIYKNGIREMEWEEETDWRSGYYLGNRPCCICGSTRQTGIEPRFMYAVCEEHSKLTPVEVGEQRKDI